MWSKGLIFTALAVYLGVVGCAVWPPESAKSGGYGVSGAGDDGGGDTSPPSYRTQKLTGLPYRGVAMQIQSMHSLDEYHKSIDEVAAIGADTVSIVVDCRQENGSSSRIFMDLRMTPGPAELAGLIKHAKERNLRVVLMPIVLLDNPRGNEWRGTIKPESWDDWFESYRAMMSHYAAVAEQNGVDLFVVGSELVSSETKAAEWTKTIRAIRNVYKGQITYSSNWDHYRSVPFWDKLDLIGMNSYWNLGKVGADTLDRREITPATVQKRWAEIQEDLFLFTRSTNKPLILLEVGWCSVTNAAHEPWDYTQTTVGVDPELQKILYQGFFQSWWGNPSLGGFMIWEWTPGEGGPQDRGYSPEGKPAEKVMREWFKKEWK
jgi:hypothetical protein